SHGTRNRRRDSQSHSENTLHTAVTDRAQKDISSRGTGCRHLRRGRSAHRLGSNGWQTRNPRTKTKVQDLREQSHRMPRTLWTHRTVGNPAVPSLQPKTVTYRAWKTNVLPRDCRGRRSSTPNAQHNSRATRGDNRRRSHPIRSRPEGRAARVGCPSSNARPTCLGKTQHNS